MSLPAQVGSIQSRLDQSARLSNKTYRYSLSQLLVEHCLPERATLTGKTLL